MYIIVVTRFYKSDWYDHLLEIKTFVSSDSQHKQNDTLGLSDKSVNDKTPE